MRLLAALVATVTVLAAAAAGTGPARAEVARDAAAPQPWLGISFSGGVREPRITEVHPGTAAAAAGLQPGDELITFDHEDLDGSIELHTLVAAHKVGARVPLIFHRDGRLHAVTVRLTAKPTVDEIIYRRLIDRAPPAVSAYDRDGAPIPAAERARRPQVWVVFDVLCDRCADDAATLAARLGEASGDGRPAIPLRAVLVGSSAEAAAFLARVPVVGTIWRMDRDTGDALPAGYMGARELLGGRYLSGLDLRNEGVIVVLDGQGVVRFATALSLGDAAHEGACTAAARHARSWRR